MPVQAAGRCPALLSLATQVTFADNLLLVAVVVLPSESASWVENSTFVRANGVGKHRSQLHSMPTKVV